MRVACSNVAVGSVRINRQETPFHGLSLLVTTRNSSVREAQIGEAIINFPTGLCNTGLTHYCRWRIDRSLNVEGDETMIIIITRLSGLCFKTELMGE